MIFGRTDEMVAAKTAKHAKSDVISSESDESRNLSATGNWKLTPGHSRPTAASIYNLQSEMPTAGRGCQSTSGSANLQSAVGNASGLDVPKLPEMGCLSLVLSTYACSLRPLLRSSWS
jgi:hypothetical protein